jgi:hypothetical protein
VTALDDEAFAAQLRDFRSTAFRWEVQRAYRVPEEDETVARFLAGHPEPPTEVPYLREWFNLVAGHTAAGRRIARVRVHEDPPTDYQRWERWIDRWNIGAGETITYLTRSDARAAGLLPAAGDADWWLLDSARLLVMHFDDAGTRTGAELITEPAAVARAHAWWDVAARHSAPRGRE